MTSPAFDIGEPGARVAGRRPAAGNRPGPEELLFSDDHTRVRRLWRSDGGGTVICKEARGPGAAARLRDESNVLSRLTGVPGVPRLAGVSRAGALVLEDDDAVALSGEDHSRPVDLPEFAWRLSAILADVHRCGVVHRDISPGNVLLAGHDRSPLLIDFDLAATFVEDRPGFGHHREILGTLPYLAPEQTGRSGLPVDHRADLYSLGALLYELASGEPPFGRGTGDELQLVHDILLRPATPLAELRPDLPVALSDIVARLLEKEPSRRYQSAEGLTHDLAVLCRDPRLRFRLGESDFPPRLSAPSHLIGRDDDLVELRRAFQHALTGPRRGLLVAGAPGVGKSALVNQLRPIVAGHGGWFVAAKSDQFRPDVAAGALVQAMRGLGRLLLAEPEAELAAARERLGASLGPGVEQIASALPEFGVLLGPTTPGHTDPVQAQAQLRQGVLDLLAAVVSPERPLVMVLDDLQWADPATLSLIDAVLTGRGPGGLLLVGTYREEEVDPTHPLAALLARWLRLGVTGPPLRLANLPPAELGLLLKEMLRLPAHRATDLADALAGWSGGNPYDTVEQVNALRRDEVLVLGEGGWHWDDAAIRRYLVRGDIEELLRERILALPAPARELLQVAECLGGDVAIDLLALAADHTPAAVRTGLEASSVEGLVLLARTGSGDGGTEADTVRFRHDRVREAVNGLLDPEQRTGLRLAIARRLAGSAGYQVEAAEQYLACADAPIGPGERRRIAQVYRVGAANARRTSNNPTTERFLRAALDLWAGLGVPPTHPRLIGLSIEEHAALYALGRLDEADAVYADLARDCPDPVELTPATCVQVSSLSQRHHHGEAVSLGVELLARLARSEPPAGFADQLPARLSELDRWASTLDLAADLTRPESDDPRLLAAEQLLSRVLPSAFFLGEPGVVAWIVLESQRMWQRHGPGPALAANLSCVGLVTMPALDDYRMGYTVGHHVLAVAETRDYEPLTSVLRHRFALHAMAWVEPLEHAVEQARRAHEGLLRGGDLQMASHTYLTVLAGQLDCGRSLDGYHDEIEAALAFASRTGNAHSAQFAIAHQELWRELVGEDQPDARPDADLAGNPLAANLLHVERSVAAAILDDPTALFIHSGQAMAHLAAIPGYPVALAHLLRALGVATRLQSTVETEASRPTREHQWVELDAHGDWLAARAVEAPANFAHLVGFVDAERARAGGDFRSAAAAFDRALGEPGLRERPWHRALITERAARLYLANDLHRTGLALLAQARRHYADWGAAAKVAMLDLAHPGLAQIDREEAVTGPVPDRRSRSGVSADDIDMVAILRASQALSSQTSLDHVHAAIVEQLTTLTGATDVLVALRNEDTREWFLPAMGGAERAIPVEEAGRRGLLPITAFRYAERTGEDILVADATTDDRFTRDPYLAGLTSCALLVVPIVNKGAAQAILLLANQHSSGAFTADRLDAVKLMAGQLTVSLGNALLYGSLEERVEERTQALAAANRQLEVLSVTDSLTGLANRRRFGQLLDAEWDRAIRTGRPVGIVMIDVDLFKRYNDSYGHLAGDECLRQVAHTLAGCTRSAEDLVARYGGEEFAIVLPGADGGAAHAIGEQSRAAVAALAVVHPSNQPGIVTVSVGTTAVAPTDPGSAEEIVAYADAAMYEAKKAGRNRVRSVTP